MKKMEIKNKLQTWLLEGLTVEITGPLAFHLPLMKPPGFSGPRPISLRNSYSFLANPISAYSLSLCIRIHYIKTKQEINEEEEDREEHINTWDDQRLKINYRRPDNDDWIAYEKRWIKWLKSVSRVANLLLGLFVYKVESAVASRHIYI